MLQQLTERVWYLPHDEPSDRPVLTYIEGAQLSVAVDAGASPAHVREFYTAITDQRLSIPEITILTHWHWDHSFGLCAVNGFTLASKKTAEKLKEMTEWAWTPEAMEARLASGQEIPFCHEHICLEYRRPEWISVTLPDMTLAGEGTMDIGGVTIRCETCDSPQPGRFAGLYRRRAHHRRRRLRGLLRAGPPVRQEPSRRLHGEAEGPGRNMARRGP